MLEGAAALGADDLERLAVAAHLVGRDDESGRAWERAHHERARVGDLDGAARCAVWLAIVLLLRGEIAKSGGWMARASRLVEEVGDCLARGYLTMPEFLEALVSGDAQTALELATRMVDAGRRFDDADLHALATLGCGQARLALGETTRGMRLLDEAMVAVASGEVSPIPAGIVYCAVIEACMEAMDVRRAAEWTDALSNWCTAQPDLVPYRGQCLVHRSQVLQAHGEWTEAFAEVERARQRLSQPAHPALGLALYQQGELLRLRGDLAAAERAFREASEHGREPAPGLALLRLEEGKVEAAVAAVRRMVDESRGRLAHPAMLAACVEIMLAAGDVASARSAAEELLTTAGTTGVPLVRALGNFASGAVLVAEDQAAAALTPLRSACAEWRDLEMPYDAARARVQIAIACRALGDLDAAELEADAARATFARLGAGPDLARLAHLVGAAARRQASELTERECEVVRLVAAGMSNREIASRLVISEHTVARHLQNIFMKLGISSRAAATAYAYDHHLV